MVCRGEFGLFVRTGAGGDRGWWLTWEMDPEKAFYVCTRGWMNPERAKEEGLRGWEGLALQAP